MGKERSRGMDYSPLEPRQRAEIGEPRANGLRRSWADLRAFLRILAPAAAALLLRAGAGAGGRVKVE